MTVGLIEHMEPIVTHSPPEELMLLQARICQALSDPKRILILHALDEHPRHVNDLANDLGLPQTTVSRHLRILRGQSLVLAERQGTWITYRVADRRIIQVLEIMRQVILDALRLKTAVLSSSRSV